MSAAESQGASPAPATKPRKYLIFKLNENDYGVPLSDVKEVIGLPSLVQVAGGPKYYLGLINLRGAVISVIDLKLKIQMPMQPSAGVKRPVVILTEWAGGTLGCAVDSIREVISIEEALIDRSIDVQIRGCGDFIQGIARFQDRPMVLILNLKEAADISEVVVPREPKAA